MRKIFLLVFVTLSAGHLTAQSYTQNLQKYWWYRYMLVNDFMKVGLGYSESIPAEGRSLDPSNEIPGHHLHWGDATQKLGNYFCVLATEYRLLSQNGLSTERTKYELYCALKALERLDLTAEEHCRNFAATEENQNINPVTSGPPPWLHDLNGFFIRDDVSRHFIKDNIPNKKHFNRPGVCNKIEDAQSDLILRTDRT